MIAEKGFDVERYLEEQSAEILKRVGNFDKLYLEFGGKIYGDFHAARVLPGYDPDTKIRMLQMIKDKSEIVFCISAKDIENTRIRGDFNLTYETMALKSINDLRNFGLDVSSMVINRFAGEKKALKFKQYLENIGVKCYLQNEIEGYPADVDKIVSDEGYGKNPYVETSKPVVIVTGVAPGSGKMSLCLSQMYLDSQKGIKSGFAKFETFPIWNLPIDHPVNVAYEAATVDIGDFNLVDPFHLEAYNISSINYNRDVENFPILMNILKKIGNCDYKSPTDMGVSKAKEGIVKNFVVEEAAKQEAIRRYFRHKKERLLGVVDDEVVKRIEKIMQRLGLKENDRKCVMAARRSARECILTEKGNNKLYCGAAIELMDGRILTGKNSPLLHAESAVILNALKKLASIPDDIHLITENLIKNIIHVKKELGAGNGTSLNVNELLIVLGISAGINPAAEKCVQKIKDLRNCEMHTTHLPSKGDEVGIRNLGINLTTSAELGDEIYLNE